MITYDNCPTAHGSGEGDAIVQRRNFDIDVETYSTQYTVVRLSGEFDMLADVELKLVLDRALEFGGSVEIDLSGVSFMYTGTASTIVDAVDSSSASVEVFAPNRQATLIFSALGADDLIGNSGRAA